MQEEHLSLRDVHEHGETGHVVTLAADVGGIPEEQLTALRGPSACPTNPAPQQLNNVSLNALSHPQSTQFKFVICVMNWHLRNGMVPKHTNRFGPVLSLQQGVFQDDWLF